MSYHTPRYQSGMMGPNARRGVQQNPQARFPPAHPNALHPQARFPPAHPNALPGEIQRLSSLLEMESAGRFEDNQKLAHLEAELEETKLQLKRQKGLKEMFINQAKEAKRELERVQKFSDPAVLNAAVIASKVHNDVKYKKKKPLQQDFVELKVAHILSQEAFVAEIQAEREKSQALQKELEELQTSHEELQSKYEADVARLRQEAETQKCYEVRLSEELDQVRVSYEELKSRYETDIMELQSTQAELEKVNTLYQELHCQYETDVTSLKQQAEKYQQETSCLKNDMQTAVEDLLLPDTMRAETEFFQPKPITVFQEKEEDLQSQVDLGKVLSQEVSSEEELSGETLSGCSSDPESTEETEISGETILEDLENPDIEAMQDGKKKKSKFSIWKKIQKTLRLKKPKKPQKSEEPQNQEHV
ncbi:A-kinase anchor protein 9-like [Xiphophorus couchianus]|uniref:A-kinase anchor protein 9-like n=1 Tax=Xiphophorus couchianus TaxID=32473 RepID=UPI001016927A|nr:A-kinase anchor protein 9-like [Xiphophorus couchianus]